MAATYSAGGDKSPRMWPETRVLDAGNFSYYDLAPDGKRLVAMVESVAGAGKPALHLTYLLNFFDELRRRAPQNSR